MRTFLCSYVEKKIVFPRLFLISYSYYLFLNSNINYRRFDDSLHFSSAFIIFLSFLYDLLLYERCSCLSSFYVSLLVFTFATEKFTKNTTQDIEMNRRRCAYVQTFSISTDQWQWRHRCPENV